MWLPMDYPPFLQKYIDLPPSITFQKFQPPYRLYLEDFTVCNIDQLQDLRFRMLLIFSRSVTRQTKEVLYLSLKHPWSD